MRNPAHARREDLRAGGLPTPHGSLQHRVLAGRSGSQTLSVSSTSRLHTYLRLARACTSNSPTGLSSPARCAFRAPNRVALPGESERCQRRSGARMCDSCSNEGSSRGWRTPGLLIVAALIATLAALGIASVGTRAISARQTLPCSIVRKASVDYAADITRDLHAGTQALLADTDAFTGRLRADTQCQRSRASVRSARAALIRICTPCVARLDRAASD